MIFFLHAGGEIHDDAAAIDPSKTKEGHPSATPSPAVVHHAPTEKKPEAPHAPADTPAATPTPKVKHYEVKATAGLASPNVHKH